MKLCRYCRKQISKKKNSNSIYCSLNCKTKFNNKLKKNRRYTVSYTKKCTWCNNKFFPYRKSNRFCSRVCASLGRKGDKVFSKVVVVCKHCKQEYRVKKSWVEKTKFCSRKCKSSFESKAYKNSGNPNYKDGRSLKKAGNMGSATNYNKGKRYEYKTRKVLEERGYYVMRSGASKGLADLLAFNKNELLVIQVKSGKSPFRSEDKKKFLELKVPDNAKKQLWSWKFRKPVVITEY